MTVCHREPSAPDVPFCPRRKKNITTPSLANAKEGGNSSSFSGAQVKKESVCKAEAQTLCVKPTQTGTQGGEKNGPSVLKFCQKSSNSLRAQIRRSYNPISLGVNSSESGEKISLGYLIFGLSPRREGKKVEVSRDDSLLIRLRSGHFKSCATTENNLNEKVRQPWNFCQKRWEKEGILPLPCSTSDNRSAAIEGLKKNIAACHPSQMGKKPASGHF